MRQLTLSLLLLVISSVGGCGSSGVAEAVRAANDTNIKKAGSLYQLYASRNGYVGPRSKEQFLEFLANNQTITRNFELLGLDRDNISQYLTSENDGEEFAFRWGVFINPDIERSREPLVFEQTGSDGTRLVLLSNRKVLKVDTDKKYEALLNGRVSRTDAMTDQQRQELEEAAVE